MVFYDDPVSDLKISLFAQILQFADRIIVKYHADEKVSAMLEAHRDYIASEVLALEFTADASAASELDVNGSIVKVDVVKA